MKSKLKYSFALIFPTLIALYFLAYFKIMDQTTPAFSLKYNKNPLDCNFSSSLRNQKKSSDIKTLRDGSVDRIEWREVTFWNYIFYPADFFYHLIR